MKPDMLAKTNPPNTKLRRNINGILLLDKPPGMSSNRALQIVKRLFCAKKAGHTGSLDPLATGMLPLCFGEATKFSQYLLEADKHYRVEAKLGIRTNTGDGEGEILAQRAVPKLTQELLDKVFDEFRGEISQRPPMFSALKFKGQPLYQLARRGIEIDRPNRYVRVDDLQVHDYREETIYFDLKCSKGTYVRTIVDDMGERLGCGAYVRALRRMSVGGYDAAEMVKFDLLENQSLINFNLLDHHLLPIATSVKHWPSISVTTAMAFYLKQGQSVMVPKLPDLGLVQLVSKEGQFLGIGEVLSNGMVAPRRIVR